MKGNPLLNAQAAAGISGDFSVTRRWDDDVVFKNCAKMEDKEDGGAIPTHPRSAPGIHCRPVPRSTGSCRTDNPCNLVSSSG